MIAVVTLVGCGEFKEGFAAASEETDSLDGIYAYNGSQVIRSINFRKNGRVLAQQILLGVTMEYTGKYTVDGEVVTVQFETIQVEEEEALEDKTRWVMKMRGDGSLIQRKGAATFEYYKK